MPGWSRVATRLRVPLGFLFAAAYLWFARPRWLTVLVGSGVVLAGLLVRAAASGHIRKNAQLATTGPYAYVRNPLYLGSILIAAGFFVAARNWWIGLGALAMFLFVYVPVIQAEEKYLRANLAGYDAYCAQVSRFLPRLTPYRAGGDANEATMFSRELYMRHREYNALIGSVLMMSVLILKMVWP
ncbi:MAG TPA: isoprenylcysteine carboxylmethyltransferase family protein [Candidatus Angelobacter sp.]|nr:isoprenylcysteine carboxylmethyltransferase family protein [Candidatus Angelobacter sp.]